MRLLDQHGRPMAAQYQGGDATIHRTSEGVRRPRPYDEDRVVTPQKLGRLREQCLALRRDNPIVAGVCKRFADHVVGPRGITPQAKTSDPEWNQFAEEYWAEWSKIADYRQRMSLRELQAFHVDARLTMGDSGEVLLDNGQIQPIEGMRIADPDQKDAEARWVHGVRLSNGGIPITFCIHQRDAGGLVSRTAYENVAREDFVFLASPFRADQIRGIPDLAPLMTSVEDIDEMQKLNLLKAKADATRGWAISSEAGAGKIANLGDMAYDVAGEDGKTKKYERFGANQNYYLNKGEKAESLESKTPNAQYMAFVEMALRMCASALSLPYEFLLLDFKQGSFSASRAALMTTYRTFAMWQQWLIDRFLQRTWNWRIAKAIKAGDLPPAPLDARGVSQWWRVQWMPPRYDWIDPKAEAIANEARVRMGTTAVGGITHTAGEAIEDVMDSRLDELLAAADRCKRANDRLKEMGLPDRLTLDSFIQTNAAKPAEAKKDEEPVI